MITGTIKINDVEFVELKDIIYQHSSITFAENKKYLLENRISKRLQELNFTSFKDYIYYLKYDAKKREELLTLINLVTINETYFLRERPQMDYLVKNVLPQLIASGKRTIRIWSAACSSGEEPYSLAILIKEAGLFQKANIEILATDINSEVVKTAQSGEYRTVSFRGVTPDFIDKNFTKDGFISRINDDIRSKVKFSIGNLTAPTIGSQIGKVDVVFCRNVLIYFDVEGKKKVINTFFNVLNAPGHLFLGHSETLNKISESFTMNNFGNGIVYMKK